MNPFEIAVVAILVLLILFELRDGGFRERLKRNDARLRRNLAFLAASIAVMVCVRVVTTFVQEHSLSPIHWRGWIPVQIVCCFLIAELAGWLLHYVKHVNGFLWKFHFQHHREEHFDIWLTAHTHGLEVVVSGAVVAAATSAFGFAPIVTELYVFVYTVVKVYQHSTRDYRLGFLDRVIVGPGYHRLHHAVGSRCNYAVTLTLYDVLFRTAVWPPEDHKFRAVPVGLEEPDGSPFGFWQEMTFFLRRQRRERANAGAPLGARQVSPEPETLRRTGQPDSEPVF